MRFLHVVPILAMLACTDSETTTPIMSITPTCAASPGGTPPQFVDLRVYFDEQKAAASNPIRIITYYDREPERVFAATSAIVDVTGHFEQLWTNGYRRQEYQPIVYFVDVDGDGRCTAGVDLGERFLSSGFNPFDNEMLEHDLSPLDPLPVVTADVCADVARCF